MALKIVYSKNLETKFLLVLALARANEVTSKPTTSVKNANFGCADKLTSGSKTLP